MNYKWKLKSAFDYLYSIEVCLLTKYLTITLRKFTLCFVSHIVLQYIIWSQIGKTS